MKKITLLIIVSLLSFCGYAQLPNESFENPWVPSPTVPAPPGGWSVIQQYGPFVTWIQKAGNPDVPANTGNGYAWLDKENVCGSCDIPTNWLITKPFPNPPNGQGQLRFFSRLSFLGDNGGIYKVKIFTEGPGKDPNNIADYTDLVTWTEPQLNTFQLQWTEKIINMPNFTGNIRIAFVMQGNGKDTWFIDDVSCTSPCAAPSGITVTSKTLSTATLDWTNNSGTQNWQIDIVPASAPGPSGNWKTYTGALPHYVYGLAPGETLNADTDYKVYIRALCTDSGISDPANPFYFSTAGLGDTCSDPVLIPSPLPYTTIDNTSNYANTYLGNPGATGCNGSTTFLQGNDVVYKYTPDITGTIHVSVTNNVANTGIFIYANCADIGTTCLYGTTTTTVAPLILPTVAVTAGTPIYIVISSNSVVANTPYKLTLQQVFCDAPTAPTVTGATSTTATVSWTGTATEYQVAVRPAGTVGLPTGGKTVTGATTTILDATTAPLPVGPLTPSTNYEYYVRAKCNPGTDYSIWVGPVAFSTTQLPASLNFTEDFQTLPSQWTLVNGNQTNTWAINANGTTGNTGSGGTGNSLFISNDGGLNNLYTLTSASVVHAYRDVTIPANVTSLNLSFDWKCFGQSGATADGFRVYLAPVTVVPVAGTVTPSTNLKVGPDFALSNTWQTASNVITVPTSATPTTRRLIFEWYNNANSGTQFPASVDNINLSIITCPAPGAPTITAGTLAATSVGIQWTAPTGPAPANGYDIYLGPSSTQPGVNPVADPTTNTIVTTSTTVTKTGIVISPSTAYYVWVRANCGTNDKSTWTGPIFFVAPQIPAGMDYTQNFDGAPHEWALNNGTLANKWVVGTAVNNGGTKSLYISSDGGVTNSYNNLSGSVVQAYRDIQMPAAVDQLELSFDWKNVGEASDFFRVWLINTDYTPTPNTQIPTAAGRLLVPSTPNPFANTAAWTNFKYIVQGSTGYAGTTKRLVFEWINNATGGSTPPAAIDNINLKVVPCPQPSAPLVAGMTSTPQTVVNFTWTAPVSGASAYQYYYGTTIATPPANPTANISSTATAAGSFSTADGLQPSSTYYFWVRTDCGTSKSYWVGPVKFITPQIPAPMDYTENFDGAAHGYQFINDNQNSKWFVGAATFNSSPNSLYISNDNGVNNAYTATAASVSHAYRDIQLPAVVTDVQLTFDWKGTGEAGDYFKVWMVPIDFVPTAGTQITAVAGSRVPVGATFYNNAGWKTENFIFNVNTFQGQSRRLVFEWTNNAFTDYQRPAAIDNVKLASVTCYPPANLTMPSNNAGGATFAWTAPTQGAAGYDYYYTTSIAAPTSTTAPSNAAPLPSTSVTLAGLPHSSNFYFWVRSNCGPNSKSVWVGPLELNTAQQASTLPYVQNFDGITHGWTLRNGTQQNKWTVGTAVSNSPGKSLYISDTNGETNNFNLSVASATYAYKDFFIPATATALDLSFNWKNAGDAFGDYIRVWRVPTTYVPPVTGTAMTLPANSQLITTTSLFSSNNQWATASFTLDPTAYANTNQRIIFEWVNNTFTGPQAPAAIDNIDLQVITCPKPTGLSATAVTSTSANVNWSEAGTATSWEVYVIPSTQAAPTANTAGIPVTSTDPNPHSYNYTTPPLEPSTSYGFYVRSICGTNDKSKWSGPFAFKTAIANDECSGAYTLGVNDPSHSCQQFAMTSYAGATASSIPYSCGATINGADIWYEFVATGERHNIELSDFAVLPTNVVAMPIVISLYQGQDCDILQPLECSTVNVYQARNLIPGATYKVRLSMNSTTPNLTQTSFKVCINTPAALGTGGTSACAVTTVNANFDDPKPAPVTPPSPYPNMVHHNTVQGWRTTATDGIIEVWPAANFENVPAYDAGQFVELNANQNAGLYQDYATPQVTTFTYKFAHRGRSCIDKIELRAGNANIADPKTLPLVTVHETGFTGGWSVYTGTYTSVAGNQVTRFFFNSASSCNGDPSVGNFLDGVEFTADNSIVSHGPDQLTCLNNVLTVDAAGSGEWSADNSNPSEVVITDPSNPNTTMTGFSKTGDYKFYWTTLYCQSDFTVNYNNGNVPAPVATTQIDYCVNETPVALTATALTGNTLNWYTTATGGTADATAPTPTTTATGTTTYYVSQTAPDSCESPRTAIAVIVHAIPTAPIAATTYNYCQNATAITLTATVFTNHTLNWYTVPTGGTASTTAPTPDTSVAGTTIYYVSQTSQFGCESNRTAITINVAPGFVPVTNFTLPASVCISDPNPTPVLPADFTTGGYFTGAGGLIIDPATGVIDLTQSTPGTYTIKYTVDADASVCNSGNSTSVQIVVTPLAAAVTGFSYTTPSCANTPNQLPSLATGFSTGGVFSAPTGLVIDAATGEINLAASTTGTYIVTYDFTGTVADCTADGSANAEIRIVPVFEPVVEFGYDTTYCYDLPTATPTLDPAFTAGGTFSGSTGLVIDPVTGEINIAASTSGVHTVTYTFNADTVNCIDGGSKNDTFTIGTELQFVFNGECNGTSFIVTSSPDTNSSFEGSTGLTFLWTTATGAPVGTNDYTFNVSDFASSGNEKFPQEFLLTITDANGCETTRSHIVEGIGCSIQKGISPNNDGYNDYFDLEYIGVKKLSIFNRYGQEVYTKSNYKKEWNGQGKNGDELPTGTYYYVVERSAGGTDTGWVYINRED